MILTDRAKEDFLIYKCGKNEEINLPPERYLYADIIEWFDRMGIMITIEGVFDRMLGYHRGFEVHIYQDGKQPISISEGEDVFNTRQEATKEAILKANQIYNEKTTI